MNCFMLTWLPLLVSTRFQVLFHSPHWGSFRLSLTVLVHYRSQAIFSLGRWSSRIPARLHVSRGTRELLPGRALDFAYGTITRFGCPFQEPSAIRGFFTSRVNPEAAPQPRTYC